MILFIIAYILLGVFVASCLQIAFGYNLTKNETDQIIISELCYAGVDLGECNLLYGSIKNDYGEALK